MKALFFVVAIHEQKEHEAVGQFSPLSVVEIAHFHYVATP